MSISTRQFEILSEMDIPLWQSKEISHTKSNAAKSTPNNIQDIDIEALARHQFFKDILSVFDVSIGEIQIQNSTLNLGLFNWSFSNTQNINFENNTLITPELSQIIDSSKLKQKIWQNLHQVL